MRISFICLFSLISSFASAQLSYPPSVKVLSVQPKKQNADTDKHGSNKLRLKAYRQTPDNNIPNAVTNQPQPAFVYKGNNGGGFDIYQSTLDGMAVICPDKNNKHAIPTIGHLIDPRITPSMPKQALTDSLLKIKKP